MAALRWAATRPLFLHPTPSRNSSCKMATSTPNSDTPPEAVINAAIKSGTNSLHGDLWEYFRNDDFDANHLLQQQQAGSGVSPESVWREPSAARSIFQRFTTERTGRSSSFDYQGDRLITPAPATSTVPTANMVNSGFTNLQDLITCSSGSRNRCPGPDVLSWNHS